jgi:ACR3 family arsenite efflux pump ArsB
MNIIEKSQTFLILAAMGLGLFLGQFTWIEQHAEAWIMPFLFLMLYGLFLTIPLQGLKQAFHKRTFVSTSVLMNFVWTPLLAGGLGALFLSDHPALWLGFILLLVTPCTDWYLVFTSIAKGNVSLSTSILPVNLLLQVTLLPVYLFIFAGTMGTFEGSIILEVVLFLAVPFVLATLTRYLFRQKKKILEQKVIPFFASSQMVFLCLAIAAMFASEASYLLTNLQVILLMLLPLGLFYLINFFLAQGLGKVFAFPVEDIISLNMTTIARNSPIALAIVLTAFPDQPLIALALIIGPLLELPVLAVLAQVLLKMNKSPKPS